MVVTLRLRAKICGANAFCQEPVQENGHHILHCKGNQRGVISRHNQINKLLVNTFRKAQYGGILEPKHFSFSTNKCQDVVTLQP